jgi:hypothetical protein
MRPILDQRFCTSMCTLLPFASEPSSQHLIPPPTQAILIDVSLSYLYRHDCRSCELFECGFDVHDDDWDEQTHVFGESRTARARTEERARSDVGSHGSAAVALHL